MIALVERRDGTVRWQALPTWEPILFGPHGLKLDEWRAQRRVEAVKAGGHRSVYRVDLPGRAFYVKHYRRDRWIDGLQHLLRPSASRREWQNAREIARRRIPTIRPVAWAEQVRGGLIRDNYLVTEAVQPAIPLDEHLLGNLPQLPPPDRFSMRGRVLDCLARFVAAMHEAGIVHNDLHLGNLLLTRWSAGPELSGVTLPVGAPRASPIDRRARSAVLGRVGVAGQSQESRDAGGKLVGGEHGRRAASILAGVHR
ncbi:MAG: lipopolysaccharide kinase InaA family protein [Planctomycetota bacterium]